MIPLRPEMVEFLEPQGLCRYTCCSKTARTDVRDTRAWQLLVRAQMQRPRPARDTIIAAENDAVSIVRPHVRRRLLADALSQRAQPPTLRATPLDGFTFFARFEDGGVLIWEGDLDCIASGHWEMSIDLSDVWSETKASWDGMVEFLSRIPRNDSFDESLMRRIKITIVAIRVSDQAMVSLGCYRLDDYNTLTIGEGNQQYSFKSTRRLISFLYFYLKPEMTLQVVHDDAGSAISLAAMDLELMHYSVYNAATEEYIDQRTEEEYRYVLTYLAGVHHVTGEHARATMQGWHDEFMQDEE